MNSKEITGFLKAGNIGVMPTDTIYGLVGLALNKKAVSRIYKVRCRQEKKPMIILIGSFDDLDLFGIKLDTKTKKKLKEFWPGKFSIILPRPWPGYGRGSCPSQKFFYLHRGTKSLAFRLPKPAWFRKLLKQSGPLVAPSANPEGQPPAKNIAEARQYFGEKVDFYLGGRKSSAKPSTLLKLEQSGVTVLRK